MRLGNTFQSHTQIQKRQNLVVNNTIKIQTPSVTLSISQEAAILYTDYIAQNNTPVAHFEVHDIMLMKNVQGDHFNAHPYSKYLEESIHSMRYSI